MNLLQQTLNEIEAEAEKKSAVAIAHADRICELESLVKTLKEHGAEFVQPNLIVCDHYDDIENPNAIIDRIVTHTSAEYEVLLEALHDAEICFTTEVEQRADGRKSLIHRVIGMSAYIECFNFDSDAESEHKRAA